MGTAENIKGRNDNGDTPLLSALTFFIEHSSEIHFDVATWLIVQGVANGDGPLRSTSIRYFYWNYDSNDCGKGIWDELTTSHQVLVDVHSTFATVVLVVLVAAPNCSAPGIVSSQRAATKQKKLCSSPSER